jgi:HEPN domain-containing protein
MANSSIVQEWLARAEDDFQFARLNLEEKKSFYAQICFHFQQAAEKYLKAYIIANDLEFQKIHDLSLLVKVCLSKNPSFDNIREDCEFLNTFYIDSRYPVHWPTNFSESEAQKAFQASVRIRTYVLNQLDLKP